MMRTEEMHVKAWPTPMMTITAENYGHDNAGPGTGLDSHSSCAGSLHW